MSIPARPFTLTIAALGGQGGGVVQAWMTDVARQAGYLVQATSVPGVAQRTGATIYYLEFFPADTGQKPVMALMPVAQNCDLVVASELLEAARMVQRGFVSDELTTLVTSNHRAYTIDEKTHLADGRMDRQELLDLVQQSAKQVIAFDMEALAIEHGSVVSAAMLGGIAAAGILPFPLELYEQAIRESGRGVEPSLATFRAALKAGSSTTDASNGPSPTFETDTTTPLPEFPDAMAAVIRLALPRLNDYQDQQYAGEYLAKLRPFCRFEDNNHTVGVEVARGLALWMTFEDTIRVADLKTRPERLQALMSTTSDQGELTHVTEFMKPRIEEIAGTLPAGPGRWLARSRFAQACLTPLTGGIKLRSSGILGYLVLRMLAALKAFRRTTLRFEQESSDIAAWLELVTQTADSNQALAAEIAGLQQLITGYGDTRENGSRNYRKITNQLEALAHREDAPAIIRALREAALKEDTGQALSNTFSTHSLKEVTA